MRATESKLRELCSEDPDFVPVKGLESVLDGQVVTPYGVKDFDGGRSVSVSTSERGSQGTGDSQDNGNYQSRSTSDWQSSSGPSTDHAQLSDGNGSEREDLHGQLRPGDKLRQGECITTSNGPKKRVCVSPSPASSIKVKCAHASARTNVVHVVVPCGL